MLKKHALLQKYLANGTDMVHEEEYEVNIVFNTCKLMVIRVDLNDYCFSSCMFRSHPAD